jgi:Pyruvate/2-oxoacid:ferredoxin oxidoreductase gamma subunit
MHFPPFITQDANSPIYTNLVELIALVKRFKIISAYNRDKIKHVQKRRVFEPKRHASVNIRALREGAEKLEGNPQLTTR